MPRLLIKFSSFLVFLALAGQTFAFSLLGPLDTRYQIGTIGYNTRGFDIGGPMNLGEEYRWNLPNITYGYDKTFLDYFGQQGIDAIEKAIKILNDLPAASEMSSDLSEFPIEGAKRINYRAAALGLLDIKSMALGALLEELGLASSTRYVWTLRDRRILNNIPQYLVIQRNFDPISWMYSPYVNETLFTYRITQTFVTPEAYSAIEVPVDPLVAALRTPVSGISGNEFFSSTAFGSLGSGEFYTGLTRDDAGGLRYLYRGLNINGENLPPGSTLSLTFDPNNPGGNGGGSGGPIVIGSGQQSPWDDPFGFTNIAFTNLIVGTNNLTNGPGGPIPTALAIDAALRPGIDKLRFSRVFPQNTIGGTFLFTNTYVDTFITNGVILQQPIERILTRPDILFSADDLGLTADGFPLTYLRSSSFDNNRDLNSSILNGAGQLAGPGTVVPTVEIIFNKLGPFLFNLDSQPFLSGNDLTESGSATFSLGAFWGHFDGSTNAPILFPNGTSIQQLEQIVLGTP